MKPEEMSMFPVGEPNDAYAKYFVGQSYLNMLSTEQVVVGNVTFEPGTGTVTGLCGQHSNRRKTLAWCHSEFLVPALGN